MSAVSRRDYGLTSYNMGNNSEPLGVTRWVLETALEYHTPRVAVIDVFYVAHATDEDWMYSFRHLFYDALPLSRAKIRAVCVTQPEDGSLSMVMFASCCAAMCLTIARPRPVPPVALERLLSTR